MRAHLTTAEPDGKARCLTQGWAHPQATGGDMCIPVPAERDGLAILAVG
jgi:hypothetical protein